jgi:endonuclease/exonuclease/phosphatase family metal-dependent hydrolase
MTLRVMTWNLWWRFGPWESRQPAIAAVVAAERPDVLLAQEVWGDGTTSAAHELAAALGFHVAITDDPFGGRDVGFHNAILSRWPLADVVSHALPRPDGTPGHRRVLSATVESPWGPWPFMSTHFDYRFDQSALRVLQARELLRLVAERRGDPETALPVVVGGDLNAVPESDEIRLLTGRSAPPIDNLVLGDAWEHAGNGPGCTWRDDNPYQADTTWPNRRLDYLLVSWPRPKPVGNVVSCHLAGLEAVDGVVPSDHAAVVAELRTPDATAARG